MEPFEPAVAMTLIVAAAAGSAVLVARDMDRRGREGKLYGLATLLLLPLGLVAWVIGRSGKSDTAVIVVLGLAAVLTFPLSLLVWIAVRANSDVLSPSHDPKDA